MNLAPGVEFDEGKHEYWYKGKRLSGITGLVSKKLGLKYSSEFVGEHAAEGIHVHAAVQRWIETGESGSAHPGVAWLVNELSAPIRGRKNMYSEVLVSDFSRYASLVDIMWRPMGSSMREVVGIADIKKGVFNREYATWQLSIYKYFIEAYAQLRVVECACYCLKDKEQYPIFPKKAPEVEGLLYGKVFSGG